MPRMQDFTPFKRLAGGGVLDGPQTPTRLIFLPPILKILPPIQNSTDNTDRTRNKVILVPGNAQNAGFYTI